MSEAAAKMRQKKKFEIVDVPTTTVNERCSGA